jgi:addiction module HigA family antidote
MDYHRGADRKDPDMKEGRAPTHPGGILKRLYVQPLNVSTVALAKAIGVSWKTISKLVNERGTITPEMTLRLSVAFNTTPQLWLNLQRNYDLWHAQRMAKECR